MRKIILLTLFFAITRTYASGGKEIISHVVRPHETIYRIALMYNSTVDDIIQANNGINPTEVPVGKALKVPKNTMVRDAALVAMFFKNHPTSKPQELESAQRDENPFMRPSGQGKTIDQIINESAAKTVSQKESQPATEIHKTIPGTIPQQYDSEDLRNRYLELKDQSAYDKSIKVIDMSRINLTAETVSAKQ